MSSLFQAGLAGNDFYKNPLELAYGSRITLKNMGYGGGLLHSHTQTYPTGSLQGQVTCYHYKDSNNDWIVNRTREKPPLNESEVEFVRDGDVIRLLHSQTGRNLHSHAVPAPVTKSHNEVSGYGNETLGDTNDYWILEIVDDIHERNVQIPRSLTTRMRFRHKQLGCYLRAANVNLPQWGFKQIEVTCAKNADRNDMHTYWNIERHWNEKLPRGPAAQYQSKFLNDFWHLNVAMYTTNNALVPDPDKEDILASTPAQWPILETGIRMCGWGDDQIKFYLLGNPVVWWAGSASLIVYVLLLLWYVMRRQRKYYMAPAQWSYFLYIGRIAGLGWILHYLPFFIMGRVTYLHHYFPALYFAILMVGFITDHATQSLRGRARDIVFGLCYVLVVGVFLFFKDIAFGIDYPAQELWGRKWLSTWNIYD